MEKFINAEISQDGRMVVLTLQCQYMPNETYYVRWLGGGQLEYTDDNMLKAVANATRTSATVDSARTGPDLARESGGDKCALV
jgi:hypothetical protein